MSGSAAVFPVFASVKKRGSSWRQTGAVGSSLRGISEQKLLCRSHHPLILHLVFRLRSIPRTHAVVTNRSNSKPASLSLELSVSNSDVGCCARPCWEQRLPNLRGEPSPWYTYERCGRRVLQIRDDSRHRPKEPERGTPFCLHWIRGPEVRRSFTVSLPGLRHRHCVAKRRACYRSVHGHRLKLWLSCVVTKCGGFLLVSTLFTRNVVTWTHNTIV